MVNSPNWLKFVVIVLAILGVGLLTGIIVLAHKKSTNDSQSSSLKGTIEECSSDYLIDTSLPKDPGVFQPLNEDEIHAVRDFLLNRKKLNITSYKKASLLDNFIYLIDLYLPDKDDILHYLDKGGQKPARRAQVILINGAKSVPDVEEYIVEPLPNPNKYYKLTQNGRKSKIPFNARPYGGKDASTFLKILTEAASDMYGITKESFGYWFPNCSERCLTFEEAGMGASARPGIRNTWVALERFEPGRYLHVLPMEIMINHTDRDPKNWKIEKILYNDQLFDSVEDFVRKYNNGNVKKIKIPLPSASEIKSATLERRGEPFFEKPLRGPTKVNPNGRRFSVKGRKVNYMRWQFELGLQSLIGPAIYDIRYNKNRIAYEISLQEAVAFYSAYGPKSSSAQYLDSTAGLGYNTYELVKGLDCPEDAVYFDSFHFVDTGKANKLRNSMCIFETTTDIPVRRKREFFHIPGTFFFAGGLQDNVLIVRQVMTPINYDYVTDYVFHQSGVIEVKATASGYMQTTYYYSSKEHDFGFESFYGSIMGPIHNHMVVYKVDLDVGGIKNSYQTLDIVAKNLTSDWEPGTRRIKKTIQRNTKLTEKDAILRYNFDEPKYLIMLNNGSRNRYGNPIGYRIQPVYMVKQKYPDDYFVTKTSAWTKYQVAVTRHKENERYATSIHNQFALPNPVFDFDAYIDDNESIVDQDLVAWVAVGGLHIPNTEDVPNTMTTGNSYTFFLKPFGYFDEDPTMASRESILVTKKGTDIKTQTYGTPEKAFCKIPDRKIKYPRGD